MKTIIGGTLTMLVALVSAGSLLAHHSLANFDTTTPVRVKGTVVQIHRINPHSFIYLDEKTADGRTRRWAAEGPAIRQFSRRGVADNFLKPGDEIEVCGYTHKENVIWQIATTDRGAQSVAGRLLSVELLVMPDGRELSWEDYGSHHCFAPGYRDSHSK